MEKLSPRYPDGKDPFTRAPDDLLNMVEQDLMKQRIVNVGKPVPMPPSSGKSAKHRSKVKAAKQARKKQRKK